MIQDGLLYTKDHEWVKIEGDVATVGISDHAQEHLGEITFVELPAVGQDMDAHGTLGAVESSKAASDIYSPVAGTVSELNETLEDQPELINDDCYNQGWICKLTVSSPATDDLMDAKQYEEYLKTIED